MNKCKPVRIQIKEDAEPCNFKVPGEISIQLLEKEKIELQSMETVNVVEKVTEQTGWRARKFGVKKKSGKKVDCLMQ